MLSRILVLPSMKNMELKIKLTTYWAISIIPIAINSALLSYFNTISALIISMLIFTSYMLTIKIISRKVSDINTDNLWQAGFLYIASAILLSIVFVISLTNSNAIPGTESFIDIFYFCIVTLTTLGYGDMTPKGDYAKIIACAMSLIGTTNMIILIAVVSAKLKSENSANF